VRMAVATTKGQGERANDFDWCTEGELVLLGMVCATDAGNPDARCGCGRAFSGLSSHRATTTAEIREVPLTVRDVLQAVAGYLESARWSSPETALQDATPYVVEMLDLGEAFEVGTVLERRLDQVRARVTA